MTKVRKTRGEAGIDPALSALVWAGLVVVFVVLTGVASILGCLYAAIVHPMALEPVKVTVTGLVGLIAGALTVIVRAVAKGIASWVER